MTDTAARAPTLIDAVKPYFEKAPLAAFFLGVSSGFPYAMIGATLTTRLAQDGIDKKAVTAFALTFLAYNLKWSWAPLVDKQHIPILGRLGQRRSWLIVVGLLVFLSVAFLGSLQPTASLQLFVVAAILVAVAGATFDIVIDGYRIELLEPEQLGVGSGMSQYGWRIGSAGAGAIALLIAQRSGWEIAYVTCALLALPAVLVGVIVGEPARRLDQEWPCFMSRQNYGWFIASFPAVFGACWAIDYALGANILRTMAVFGYVFPLFDLSARRARDAGKPGKLCWLLLIPGVNLALIAYLCWVSSRNLAEQIGVVGPLLQFFQRRGAAIILAFILLHKIGDTIANLTFRLLFDDLGFSNDEIALYDVGVGFWAYLIGIFVGGILYARLGLKRSVFISLILMAVSNFSFAALAAAGHSNWGMAASIGFENFASGIGGVTVVAYFSALTDLRFTAAQYALISAAASIVGRFVTGTTAGALIESMGYVNFYLLTTVLALPGVLLFWIMMRSGLIDASIGSAGKAEGDAAQSE